MTVDYFCRRTRCDYLEQTGTSQHFCMWARCPFNARVASVRNDGPRKKPVVPVDAEFVERMSALNNSSAQIVHRFAPDEVETVYRERQAGFKTDEIAERHGWTKGGTASVCNNISHGGCHYKTLIERGIDVKPFGEE